MFTYMLCEIIFMNCFSACDCNEQGSLSNVCDVELGQCLCKSNYGGRTCDLCGNGYYKYPECLCKLIYSLRYFLNTSNFTTFILLKVFQSKVLGIIVVGLFSIN